MVELGKPVNFLDSCLKIKGIKDSAWNCLQFEGKNEVKKICVAVDAGDEAIDKAAKAKADLLIVHHGIYWADANPSLKGFLKKKLMLLEKHGLSLYASHLPLDRHGLVGNNIQLLKLLGAKHKSFLDDERIERIGELKKEMPAKDFVERIDEMLETKSIAFLHGKKKTKTLFVCSGGGGHPDFYKALNEKVDLYLTGDLIHCMQACRDAGFNAVFAGHYATETLGVKALAKLLEKKFKLKTEFIEIKKGWIE
ncbi:Nif3-like dinuclear metal center hexameric protein [archaeon]|nr:Nif3-like dinuclear metal center hexameric protein [archaeon]